MALNFLKGEQSTYDNMPDKSPETFYLTETNLYLGNTQLNNQNLIGDLRDLTTTDKENLVKAINEVIVELATKADLANPSLTGTPTAPTASESSNDTTLANTKFVKTAIANLINGAPTTLDTLKELADAIAANKTIIEALHEAIGNKVDKVEGKGLSSNDYTDAEKAKLNGIQSGAEVNVQPDWNETVTTHDAYIKNKPNFLVSGTQTVTSAVDGGVNTYTFTNSNGTTSAFNVKNGSKGSKGDPGEKGVKGDDGAAGVRGSYIYQGTGITGTSTVETVFSNSGITNALINDVYINNKTSMVYQCTVSGDASMAKWVYKGCIKGNRGSSIFVSTGDLNYADATSSFKLTESEIPYFLNGTFPEMLDLCISTSTFNIVRCVSAYGDPSSSYNSFKNSEWEYVGCIRDNDSGSSILVGETSGNFTSLGQNISYSANNGSVISSVLIGYDHNIVTPNTTTNNIFIGHGITSRTNQNYYTNSNIIAIGSGIGINATSVGSVLIGQNVKSNSKHTVLIGTNVCTAYCNSSFGGSDQILIGYNTSSGNFGYDVVIGSGALSREGHSIVIGCSSKAISSSSVAIGDSAYSSIPCSVTIGYRAYTYGSATGRSMIAIGTNSRASGNYYSIAIGENACALFSGNNTISGSSAIAIGTAACALSSQSIGIGSGAYVSVNSNCSITIGRTTAPTYGIFSNSPNSIVIGTNSVIRGNSPNSIVIGTKSSISINSLSSIAIGDNANVQASFSIAIGHNATTSNANSIQLGDNANLSSITAKVELTVTSDERDKIDIKPIDYGAIKFLNKIEPITYHSNQRILYIDNDENLSEEDKENKSKYGICNYNRKEHAKGTKKGSRLRVGVSAQGVQKALEEAYGTSSYANLVNDNLFDFNKDEIPEGIESQLAVNYPGFVPFLIKAVQELSQRLDKLEGKA